MKTCPFCHEEIPDDARVCPVCGEELPIIKQENLNKSKNIFKIIISIVTLILLIVLGTVGYICYRFFADKSDSVTLYKTWDEKNIAFIDEHGNKAFEFPITKYDIVERFNDGVLFVAKTIREYQSQNNGYMYVLKVSMLDTQGNLIKELPWEVQINCLDNLPFLYKGYAQVQIGASKQDIVYINKKGEKVPSVDIDDDIKNTLNLIAQGTEEPYNSSYGKLYATHKPDKDSLIPFVAPCFGESNEDGCMGFKDKKGKTIIEPKYAKSTDVYYNKFYNGLAIVSFGWDEDKQAFSETYINKKGEYINSNRYDWTEPFFEKLAFVQLKNRYGYINTKGEWVWETTCTEEQNCVFMYLSSTDAIKNYLNPPHYDYSDEYWD